MAIRNSGADLRAVIGFKKQSKNVNASVLFNASKNTNVVFQLTNKVFNASEINAINNINTPLKRKIIRRVQAIRNLGAQLIFNNIDGDIFKNNLVLIDSLLPQIIAHLLLVHYEHEIVNLTDLTNYLRQTNPLMYDESFGHSFYSHKVKRFLFETALGMVPEQVWNGVYEETEKVNSEQNICYSMIDRLSFEDYLLNNTYLETPNSEKHHFGEIFEDNGKQYFKLNLQIRFK